MNMEKLCKAVAVTAELMGTDLSESAARVFIEDLERYPEQMVLGALTRCRREVKGKLTLVDVISRMDDGRPGAEEAWAACPKDEGSSAVFSAEQSKAFFAALPQLEAGDPIAARMTFKEVYTAECARARDAGEAPKWTPSLGHNPETRSPVLREALDKGRISHAQVLKLLPADCVENTEIAALVHDISKGLTP
jgi:hypothetical protein